jgi:hypothetical protein
MSDTSVLLKANKENAVGSVEWLVLLSFFLSLTSFYPLTVGAEFTAPNHTQ